MTRDIRIAAALLAWVATLVLIVPYGVKPPSAMSLVGLLVLMSLPLSAVSRPEVVFLAGYSYWIGLLLMLATSAIAAYVAKEKRRAALRLGLVDVVATAASVLVAYRWGA